MKFSLTKLFSVITIICLIFGLFQRPLRLLFNNIGSFSEGFFYTTSRMFWLFGTDGTPECGGSFLAFIGVFVGCVVAVVSHMLILGLLWATIEYLWNLDKKYKSGNEYERDN